MAHPTATLAIDRFFTKAGTHPYDTVTWAKRDSEIINPGSGKVVFSQKGVEFPDFWSQNAINIVAQKYFYGTPGTKDREVSLRNLIDRVADTITRHGYEHGYFLDEEEADVFNAELKYILLTQRAAFNSPVWFNIGTPDRSQQASACFILKVEDTMPSILNWYTEEGIVFKGGSGAGLNLSSIRSSYEPRLRPAPEPPLKTMPSSVYKFKIEAIVARVEDALYGKGVSEVQSSEIGDLVLEQLAVANKVAYVRFASVYKEFRNLEEFESVLKQVKQL